MYILRLVKKNIKKFFGRIIFYFLYKDIQKYRGTALIDKTHLLQAINWLKVAQDATKSGGVSAYYDTIKMTWGNPYRETTGYIIETFLNYYTEYGDTDALARAIRMGNWEIEVQCPDGSFGELDQYGHVNKKIFNTGQILIGLTNLYKHTGDKRYLSAAIGSADWIVKNQDADGSWKNFSTGGHKTYDSRVAWPLLMVHEITNDAKYYHAAKKNIGWVISQQNERGWFDSTSLTPGNRPWTHLISYTISGLLESYKYLGDKSIFNSFYSPAEKMLLYFNSKKKIPCTFDSKWNSTDTFSCITGDAQIAIVWLQIFEITKEQRFLNAAKEMIEDIKKTQVIGSPYGQVNGGIFGSNPIHGDYAPFLLINWAAKFFSDAIILKNKII